MYEKQLIKDDVVYDQYMASQADKSEEKTYAQKLEEASLYYYALVMNYKIWKRGKVGDRKSYVDMTNAAIGLARLNLPNPFEEKSIKANAATRPGKGRVVTGVTEESK